MKWSVPSNISPLRSGWHPTMDNEASLGEKYYNRHYGDNGGIALGWISQSNQNVLSRKGN